MRGRKARRAYASTLAKNTSGLRPDARQGDTRGCLLVQTVLLLVLSNVFMTFAWYAHLKELNARPWQMEVSVWSFS